MPKIVIKSDKGNNEFQLIEAEYDENHKLGEGAIGDVFLGKAKTIDNQLIEIAVKLPLEKIYSDRITEEFNFLLSLSEIIINISEDKASYTPYARLGHTIPDRLPALIMPLYNSKTGTLVHHVRSLIKQGRLLAAEKMAVKHAIELTYIFEALHKLDKTITDRKLDDHFLTSDHNLDTNDLSDERLIVIDWNMLKNDGMEERSAEIVNSFGQIWHELFLGRRNVSDKILPLNDTKWIPSFLTENDEPILEGSPSLAMRYILRSSIPQEGFAFGSNVQKLREVLQTLHDVLHRPTAIDQLQYNSFGIYIKLTSAEIEAIRADLRWRHMPDNLDLFEERRDTLAIARTQDTPETLRDHFMQMIEAFRQRDSRSALNDIDLLKSNAAFTEDAGVTINRLDRWRLLALAFQEHSTITERALAEEHETLIEYWYILDSLAWDYQEDAIETLDNIATYLDTLSNTVHSQGEAKHGFIQVIQEIDLRLAIHKYLQTEDQQERLNLLDELEQQVATIDHIKDQDEGPKGLFSTTINVEVERQNLEQILNIQNVVYQGTETLAEHILNKQYREAEYSFQTTRSELRELANRASDPGSADLIRIFEENAKPLMQFVAFAKVATNPDTTRSLSWRVGKAFQLSTTKALAMKIRQAAVALVDPDLTNAKSAIETAINQRSHTTVCLPEAQHAYTLFTTDSPYKWHLDDYLRHTLFSNNEDNWIDFQEQLGDYQRLLAFFQKYNDLLLKLESDIDQAITAANTTILPADIIEDRRSEEVISDIIQQSQAINLNDLRASKDDFKKATQTIISKFVDLRTKKAVSDLPRSNEWKELLEEAQRERINMTDLITPESLKQWQQIFEIEKIVETIDEAYEKALDQFQKKIEEDRLTYQEEMEELRKSLRVYQDDFNEAMVQNLQNNINYYISTGISQALKFERDKARDYRRKAHDLKTILQELNQNQSMSGYHIDNFLEQLNNQFESLNEIIDDLTKMDASDLAYLQDLARQINYTDEFEQYHDRTEVEEIFARNENNIVVANLQERYWTWRIERIRASMHNNSLVSVAEVVNSKKRNLINYFTLVETHFYNDNVETAKQQLLNIRNEIENDDSLTQILVSHFVENWQNRFDNYDICDTKVKTVAMKIDNSQWVADYLNAETTLEVLKALIERMRLCPIEAFTQGLMQRWQIVFDKTAALYQSFNPKSADQNERLEEYREEARIRARNIHPTSTGAQPQNKAIPPRRSRSTFGEANY